MSTLFGPGRRAGVWELGAALAAQVVARAVDAACDPAWAQLRTDRGAVTMPTVLEEVAAAVANNEVGFPFRTRAEQSGAAGAA